MLNLFLLAGQAQGQMFNQAGEWRPDFEVKSCNRLVDNEPEMTLSIKQEFSDLFLKVTKIWLSGTIHLINLLFLK